MSRHGAAESDIYRALVVDEHGRRGVSALDYLQRQSRADDGRDPAATPVPDGGQSRPDGCECDSLADDGDLPCFACFVAGFDDRPPADGGAA
jgi:hypothetical protein